MKTFAVLLRITDVRRVYVEACSQKEALALAQARVEDDGHAGNLSESEIKPLSVHKLPTKRKRKPCDDHDFDDIDWNDQAEIEGDDATRYGTCEKCGTQVYEVYVGSGFIQE